ncbi:MucBP domain-containing protein [Loigolactobacillus bifermentans]|uniref:MucBP domain-containing protein n=1 Tax=Loigolactobacillus bifermentans TaxID=1607 RepID=UPI0012AA186C|nr:MucBP domain-containing protein [Loigolactobacillus bifermentans]QGG60268.1 LPXTG cell wall anchor domain-containing protein [Loigolactobacillus bifermentans]
MTEKIKCAYEKMMAMTGDTTRHFKLYKSGKIWVIAGLATVSFTVAPQAVQAATTAEPATQTVTTNATDPASSAASSQTTVSAASSATASAAASSASDSVASSASSSTSDSVASAAQATSQAATSSASAANTEQATQTVVSAATSDATIATSSAAASVQSAATNAVTTVQNTTSSTAAASGSVTAATATSTATTSTSSVAGVATPASAATSSAVAVTALPATATQADIAAAKAQASTAYQTTGQAQLVTMKSPEQASAATASIVSSATNIGYGSNLTSFTLTVTMNNLVAGDEVSYTLPTGFIRTFINGTIQLGSVQDFATDADGNAAGTVTQVKNADGSITVTDHFNQASAQTVQVVTLNLMSNYAGQMIGQGETYTDQTLLTVGDRTYTVDVYVNGNQQASGSASFTQTITPTAHVETPTQTYPNTSVKGLLPDTDYVWSVPIKQSDGIYDDTDQALRVNQVVNAGTVITIPAPAGFELNQELTDELNAFSDQTTIAQPDGVGGAIVITVPKGSGSQSYYGDPAYRIAGHFKTTQAATDTTLTAAGAVTMVQQVVNAAGELDTDTYTAASPWTATILGTDSTQNVGTITSALGNSSVNSKQLLLDQDPSNDPKTLLQFNAQYHAAAGTNNATITLTVPDGLTINQIAVPAGGVTRAYYMLGTTSYGYQLTLADGTTETGTVAAGGTITSQGVIRTAVLTPNYLAPGATSANFELSGTLATQYDDGSAVAIGDQLTSAITMTVAGSAASDPATFTQTVVGGSIAWVDVDDYSTHSELAPGKGQGSAFSVYGTTSSLGQNVMQLDEPIFYFVIPSAFVVDKVINYQNAVVSNSTDDHGDTVVKVDFTRTGESVNLKFTNAYLTMLGLSLHNAPDAMVGSYTLKAYVTAPGTTIISGIQPNTTVTDLSETAGDAAAILVGKRVWQIDTVSSVNVFSVAQGDDLSPTTNATIDKNSSNALTFYNTVMNISGTPLSDVTTIINLPEAGDDRGSTYTYQLTGPMTLPTSLTTTTGTTVPLTGATVLYSTSASDLTRDTPDLTNYLTAAEVGDNWGSIRSVAITFDSIPANTTTGRMALTGTTADMVDQAGEIGYIGTAFYTSGKLASTTVTAASIAITGSSTIYARAHYVDATGADQYIYFTDLDKTLTDQQDTLTNDYPTTQADLSAADQALIPVGYALQANSLHLVDGQANGAAAFDQVVTNVFDGDYAQYELTATDVTVNVAYVDEAGNPIATGTVSYPDGNQHVGSAYATTQLAIKGYTFKEMATDSLAASGTLANAGGTVTYVYRKDAPVIAQDTVTKTVHYQTSDGTSLADDYTAHADFTSSTDPVTDDVTYTPSDAVLGHQANPAIKGYHVVTSPAEATTDQTVTFGDQDEIYTVVYEKDAPEITKDTVTKTVHYQTSDGTSLADDYTVHADFTASTDPVTDDVTYTPADAVLGHQVNPVIKGYHVVTSPAEATTDQTVKFGDQDQTYIVVYQKDGEVSDESQTQTQLTVHYVDQNGDAIAPGNTQSGAIGTSFTVTAPAISGYTLSDSNQRTTTGTYNGNQMTLTLKYQKDGEVSDESQTQTQLTVHYVDQNGDTIAPDNTQSGALGTGFTVTAPAISGYTLSDSSQRTTTGTYNGNQMTLTLKYQKDGEVPDESQTQTQLAVHYVDQNGDAIASDTTQSGTIGTDFTVTAPELAGYTLSDPSQRTTTGTYNGNQMTLTLKYQKDGNVPDESQTQTQLTVHYVDQNGDTIASDTTQSGTIGTDFTVMAPAISGYTLSNPSQRTTTGTYTGNQMTLTLKYQKDGEVPDESQTKTTLTVHYVDENGQTIALDTTQSGLVGTPFKVTAPTIAHYTLLTPATVTGTYQGNAMQLTYQYQLQTTPSVTPDDATDSAVTPGDQPSTTMTPDSSADSDLPVTPSGSNSVGTPTNATNAVTSVQTPAQTSHVTVASATTNTGSTANATTHATTLPQTGEQDDAWLVALGLTILGSVGLLGTANLKKRHDDDFYEL